MGTHRSRRRHKHHISSGGVVLRAATMEWWVNMVKVAGKMVMMVVFIIIMRIRCIFDPEAKSRMTEKFKAHLKLKVTDENKDILDKTADEDFMFSWNEISVMFKLMLQDASKTAKLYGVAPNPLLHDPVAGDTKNLLAMAKKSVPLVVNFGSLT